MNREDTEKAAVDYTYKEWARGGFKRASQDIFIAGAKWRINSVWNKNDVTPGYDCHVLIEDIYGNVYDDRYDADYDEYDSEITKKEIKRWAYIKDLLPMDV